MKLHELEINLQGPFNPDTKIMLDGKEFTLWRSIRIEEGMDSPAPIVHLEFLAHVRGKIRGIVKGDAVRIGGPAK